MADDAASPRIVKARAPDARETIAYVEDMLLQLAKMASEACEPALAASLAIAAIQAGAAVEKRAPGGR